MKTLIRHVLPTVIVLMLDGQARATDFHVTTAQELQNALTTAAANGSPDTIWLGAGYYVGNFNFASAEAAALTLQPEPGVDTTQVTIDGAGTGRSMNLACTAAAPITVTNLTFLRNCGGTANAALRVTTVAADVKVANCRFLGATNHQGIGVEIVSARNASVHNCIVSRTGSASGDGITLSGVAVDACVENCVVTGLGTSALGAGISIAAAGAISVTGNIVKDNMTINFQGGGIHVEGSGTIRANTATGNHGKGGGGIHVEGTATITENTVTGNFGHWGGGIHASGTVLVTENTVSGNSANACGEGGGIYASANPGPGSIHKNSVTGNSATRGGGISVSGTITVSDNVIRANSTQIEDCGTTGAVGDGAGIYASGAPTIVNNTIADNAVGAAQNGGGNGGGIYASSSSTVPLFISGNLILRNRAQTAKGNGGGLYVVWPTIKVSDNFIAENISASKGGGALLNPKTRLEFLHNTVTGNDSSGDGGGVAISISGVTEELFAYNNILWGNTAIGNGNDVWLAGTGQRKEFLNNNAHDLYGVWDIAQDNIDLAPLFYDPLHDDYHLRAGSPGIDAGTNAVDLLPPTDIDGEARVINTTPDLGADEFNDRDLHPADLNEDWVVSDAEYTAYAAAWKNDQTWTSGPVPIPADYVTRAGYLKSQGGGLYSNTGGPKPVCWKPGH